VRDPLSFQLTLTVALRYEPGVQVALPAGLSTGVTV